MRRYSADTTEPEKLADQAYEELRRWGDGASRTRRSADGGLVKGRDSCPILKLRHSNRLNATPLRHSIHNALKWRAIIHNLYRLQHKSYTVTIECSKVGI